MQKSASYRCVDICRNTVLLACIPQFDITYSSMSFGAIINDRNFGGGAITLASNGVSFPGRYGHGKPRKPVKTRHFRHYIAFKVTLFPCAFKGIFSLMRVRTFVLRLFCLLVYTRRKKSATIKQNSMLSDKTLKTERIDNKTGKKTAETAFFRISMIPYSLLKSKLPKSSSAQSKKLK